MIIKGPFYVKNKDGEFEMCENCRECCFEAEGVCYTTPCIFFSDSRDEEIVEDAE